MPDSEDIRKPVPTELELSVRRIRRLYLAQLDLDEAISAIDEIRKTGIRVSAKGRPNPLLVALTNAMVISYSRPWVHSRGSGVAEPYLPGSLLRSLTKRQRSIHEYLIENRNVAMAHTDADAADLHLKFSHDGISAIFRYNREPFTRADLREIEAIIKKLLTLIDNERTRLSSEFPQNTWF